MWTVVPDKGLARIFGRALSGAKRQKVRFVALVRRREAPPIKLWGLGGEAPGKCQDFILILY